MADSKKVLRERQKDRKRERETFNYALRKSEQNVENDKKISRMFKLGFIGTSSFSVICN
jgi:hypothetical protein